MNIDNKSAEEMTVTTTESGSKSEEMDTKPVVSFGHGRTRPRFRHPGNKPYVKYQGYSSLLELFEKKTYKVEIPPIYEEPRRENSDFPDPDNLSDYDDDLVVVPEGIDPVIYKRRRREMVATDRFLKNAGQRFVEKMAAGNVKIGLC